jgi:hypothetical protein
MIAIAGILTIIGSIVFMIAGWPVRGVHDRQDPAERISYIRDRWPAYRRSQLLFATGAVTIAVGLALLSVPLGAADPLLTAVGAVAVLAGAAAFVFFAYQRTRSFGSYFAEGGPFPWAAWAWLILTSAGLIAYAALLLLPGYPAWLAYVTIAAVVTMLAGALVVPRHVPPQLLAVATLTIGIAAALAPGWFVR